MGAMAVLTHPAKLREELKILEEQRLDCWDRCLRVTPNMGGERVTSSRNIRGREDNMNEYVAWGVKIQKKQREIEAAEAAATGLLDRFALLPGRTSARDAEVLRLRYLRTLSWTNVREALKVAGYYASLRTLSNWHVGALKRVRAFYDAEEAAKQRRE